MTVMAMVMIVLAAVFGMVFGFISGVVLCKDIQPDPDDKEIPERCTDPNVYREDLDDPEG